MSIILYNYYLGNSTYTIWNNFIWSKYIYCYKWSEEKEKRADIDSLHKEIIKTIDFKDTTKDDLQDRINIVLINEKLINKINRNLNCYSVDEANTNTEYGTTRVLSSNLSFANSNNDSTPDSSITP